MKQNNDRKSFRQANYARVTVIQRVHWNKNIELICLLVLYTKSFLPEKQITKSSGQHNHLLKI